MLNAVVDVPDLGIEKARIISQTDRIGGYSIYRVQFSPKDDEINPSTIGVHRHEFETVDNSGEMALKEPEFALGDHVMIRHPIGIEGIVTGIVHSNSGCIEYEVDYKTDRGVVTHVFPAPILNRTGQAATAGTQTGSMNRSVERRA